VPKSIFLLPLLEESRPKGLEQEIGERLREVQGLDLDLEMLRFPLDKDMQPHHNGSPNKS